MPSLRSCRSSHRTPSSQRVPTFSWRSSTTRSMPSRRRSTPCSPPAALIPPHPPRLTPVPTPPPILDPAPQQLPPSLLADLMARRTAKTPDADVAVVVGVVTIQAVPHPLGLPQAGHRVRTSGPAWSMPWRVPAVGVLGPRLGPRRTKPTSPINPHSPPASHHHLLPWIHGTIRHCSPH